MTANTGLQGITPAATGWMTQQRCGEVDADMWFASPASIAARAAKRICHTCPVMQQCRAWALADDTLEGIAGGLTQVERDNIRGGKPERCRAGHIRTDANTELRKGSHGSTQRRCRICDHDTLQRKGRAA